MRCFQKKPSYRSKLFEACPRLCGIGYIKTSHVPLSALLLRLFLQLWPVTVKAYRALIIMNGQATDVEYRLPSLCQILAFIFAEKPSSQFPARESNNSPANQVCLPHRRPHHVGHPVAVTSSPITLWVKHSTTPIENLSMPMVSTMTLETMAVEYGRCLCFDLPMIDFQLVAIFGAAFRY